MALLLLAAAIFILACLLPAAPGVPLARRYAHLRGVPTSGPARRRILALLPGHRLLPLLPRRYREMLWLSLVHARLAGRWSLSEFMGAKAAVAVLVVLLMGLYWKQTGLLFFAFAMVPGGALGWMFPDFWIKRRAAGHRAELERELPHVLNSLAICLQTGLSLRSALFQLAHLHTRGVFGAELRLAAGHVGAGGTPREALAGLAGRCGAPDLSQALGGVLEHAGKSPSTAGAAAAAAARQAWQRRRRRAEAIAQTSSLKLFLPQLLLGLPALFLVLVGPAALRLLEFFRNM